VGGGAAAGHVWLAGPAGRQESRVAGRGKWRHDAMMQPEAVIMVRVAFTLVFLLALSMGVWLAKNDRRFFGADAAISSETSGTRSYSKMMVWAIWVHVVVISAAFALFLH